MTRPASKEPSIPSNPEDYELGQATIIAADPIIIGATLEPEWWRISLTVDDPPAPSRRLWLVWRNVNNSYYFAVDQLPSKIGTYERQVEFNVKWETSNDTADQSTMPDGDPWAWVVVSADESASTTIGDSWARAETGSQAIALSMLPKGAAVVSNPFKISEPERLANPAWTTLSVRRGLPTRSTADTDAELTIPLG
jgi:hypothetical protein